MYDEFEDDMAYAQEFDDNVRAEFPKYADKARAVINSYLRKYDKHRYRVFNCQIADENMDLGSLWIAHTLIAEMIQCREERMEIPEYQFDIQCRGYLHLPFAAIEGGKKD